MPKPVVPLLRALGRVAPTLRPAGIDVTKISKDPAVVAAYQADRLVHHGKPTLALGLGIVGQFAVLPERARARSRCRCCCSTARPTRSPTRRAPGCSPTPRARPTRPSAGTTGLWHEIYNEPERAQPLADLREWLAARR